LDFGYGPGSYIKPLAQLIGPRGKIYALDINPLALNRVKRIVSRKQLKNVITILSQDRIALGDSTLDLVLLYDTLHELKKPDEILKEIHRVLKPEGKLSVSDHHLEESEIMSTITQRGWFQLVGKGQRTLSFLKV
ncbi:MAG: class I SAM-dependent methyltransferase, partial [Candidatus Aminicenantales bacterium]